MCGGLSFAAIILLLAALLSGAGNSFTTQVLYETPCSVACGDGSGKFSKPVFVAFVAFLATSVFILYEAGKYFVGRCGKASSAHAAAAVAAAEAGMSTSALVAPGTIRFSSLAAAAVGPGLTGMGEAEEPFLAPDSESVLSASSAASIARKRMATAAVAAGSDGCGSSCCCCGGFACCTGLPARRCWAIVGLWLPALLDAAATATFATALLFTRASAAVALRATLPLFSALAGRLCGGTSNAGSGSSKGAGAASAATRLSRFEVAGLGLVCLGVFAVGAGAALSAGETGAPAVTFAAAYTPGAGVGEGAGAAPPPVTTSLSPAAATLVGLGLAIASNALSALQSAAEASRVERRRAVLGPVQAAGAQGLLSAVACAIALSIFQGVSWGGDGSGHIEDSQATLCCLQHTPALAGGAGALVALFAVSAAAHMALGHVRGGGPGPSLLRQRPVMFAARALLVWAAEFGAYYLPSVLGIAAAAAAAAPSGSSGVSSTSRYGGPWVRWSWLQAAGFFLMVCGGLAGWQGQLWRLAAISAAARRAAQAEPLSNAWRAQLQLQAQAQAQAQGQNGNAASYRLINYTGAAAGAAAGAGTSAGLQAQAAGAGASSGNMSMGIGIGSHTRQLSIPAPPPEPETDVLVWRTQEVPRAQPQGPSGAAAAAAAGNHHHYRHDAAPAAAQFASYEAGVHGIGAGTDIGPGPAGYGYLQPNPHPHLASAAAVAAPAAAQAHGGPALVLTASGAPFPGVPRPGPGAGTLSLNAPDSRHGRVAPGAGASGQVLTPQAALQAALQRQQAAAEASRQAAAFGHSAYR